MGRFPKELSSYEMRVDTQFRLVGRSRASWNSLSIGPDERDARRHRIISFRDYF